MTLYLLFAKLQRGDMTFDELEAEAQVRLKSGGMSIDECEFAIEVARKFLVLADTVKLDGVESEKRKARRLIKTLKASWARLLKKHLPNAI